MTLATTLQFASSRQTGEHLLQLGISDFCLCIRTFEKRIHLIRLGPPTLKDKGLNRACTPRDEDLGAILRFCLHTFPYYPIEKFFTFLKFTSRVVCYHPLHVNTQLYYAFYYAWAVAGPVFSTARARKIPSYFFGTICTTTHCRWDQKLKRFWPFFLFTFSSCLEHCCACVLHWHANNTQSNDPSMKECSRPQENPLEFHATQYACGGSQCSPTDWRYWILEPQGNRRNSLICEKE